MQWIDCETGSSLFICDVGTSAALACIAAKGTVDATVTAVQQ